jgi:hypothetical protein
VIDRMNKNQRKRVDVVTIVTFVAKKGIKILQ